MRLIARLGRSAFFASLALFAFAGCGDDDDLPDSGIGGTGGTAAEPRPGGKPGDIGDRCETNADCSSGLCLPADAATNNLTVGTPPSGLCTQPCTSDADCAAYEDGTACVQFSRRAAYCVQTCIFGDPAEDENKCFNRPELSCQPVFTDATLECDTSLDCPAPYECFEGQCSVLPLCLPRCGSDEDCPEGRSCDFYLGECVNEAPQGKALGEQCDPDAATEQCRGKCLPLDDDGRGECFEFCSIDAPGGCGFADAGDAPVRCAGGLDLGLPLGTRDDGVCSTVCDCTAQCPGMQRCFQSKGAAAFCAAALPGAEELTECPTSGGGGAGGAGGTSG